MKKANDPRYDKIERWVVEEAIATREQRIRDLEEQVEALKKELREITHEIIQGKYANPSSGGGEQS